MANLLNQGAYGCVYYPGLTCKGNVDKAKKYVTKIEIYDKTSINEIKISNIVKKIKNYENHFSPVVKNCITRLTQIKKIKDKLEECEAVNISRNKYSDFALIHIKYINGIEIEKYMLNIERPIIYIGNIIKNYIYVLESLKLLNEKKIIHYDLHSGNILYDKDKNIPIIIDFGLSIEFKKLEENGKINYLNLKKRTMHYSPKHYTYPPELHFITYLLTGIDNTNLNKVLEEKIEEEYLERFIEDIVEGNKIHRRYYSIHNNLYGDNSNLNFDVYVEELKKYFFKFLNMSKKDCINFLFNYIERLDTYTITIDFSIILIKILERTFISGNSQNMTLEKMLLFIIRLLISNLRVDPEKRFNIDELSKLYSLLFTKSLNLNKIQEDLKLDVELNNKFIDLEKYYLSPNFNIFYDKKIVEMLKDIKSYI